MKTTMDGLDKSIAAAKKADDAAAKALADTPEAEGGELTDAKKATAKTLADLTAERDAYLAATGSKMGIILGCLAGVVVLGIGIAIYMKKGNAAEGGEQEARTLFKTQIKKAPKSGKDALVQV